MKTGGPASVSIERVAETASTNADLLAWARGVDPAVALAPRALVAERQTAGRGRLGRRWEATPGSSLTFSVAWPLAAGVDLSGLSLAVGATLADGLDPRPGAGCASASSGRTISGSSVPASRAASSPACWSRRCHAARRASP